MFVEGKGRILTQAREGDHRVTLYVVHTQAYPPYLCEHRLALSSGDHVVIERFDVYRDAIGHMEALVASLVQAAVS